jgi:hypothetical protein
MQLRVMIDRLGIVRNLSKTERPQLPLAIVLTHNWGAGTQLFEDSTMGKFSQMRFIFLHALYLPASPNRIWMRITLNNSSATEVTFIAEITLISMIIKSTN